MPLQSITEAADRLRGKASGNHVFCPGPGHSRDDRSLRVTFKANGFTVRSYADDDWRDCRDYVKAVLGLSDDRPTVPANDHVDVDALRRSFENRDKALGIWARSVSIRNTLAETYLASRRLSYMGAALRYWPGGRAMVALMTDAITGEPTGIHRTFLDAQGRKREKKMLGPAAGAVVRLSDDADISIGLGVAEGIETALATDFRPMWACLSAGGMKRLPVLDGIEALSIFADNDRAGIEAANDCGERWHAAGREVNIHHPEAVGADFAEEAA